MLEQARKKLNGLGENKQNQQDSLEKAIHELDNRKEIIQTQKEDAGTWSEEELTDIVQDYVIGLSGIDPSSRTYVDSENDIDESWDQFDVFQWGEWRFNKNRKIVDSDGNPIGYSSVLSAVIAPKGGNSTIQVYKSIPDPIEWELTEINQKNVSSLSEKQRFQKLMLFVLFLHSLKN